MLPLLPLSLLPAGLLNLPSLTPPTPAAVFKAVDLAVYAADRQRDELLSGVKRSLLGEDPLDALSPSKYALEPGTSTVAVTGATDGIGREAALFLAKAGYGVVICARDADKGARVASDLRRDALDARVSVVPLDLASVRSVEDAVPLIQAAATELGSPLRGLVLNAGVWPGKLQTSVDGMELALHACHIGHQQLTQRLLPDLQEATGEARVVTVSSSAHAFASDAGLDDPMWASTSYDTNQNYGRAKFANMLFAQELAQRAPAGVVSTVAHPGLVLTTLFKELGPNYEPDSGGSLSGKSAVDDRLAGIPALKMLRDSTPLKVVLKSPEEGCRPLMYALLAPGLPNGAYISDCELRDISPPSKGVAARTDLWEWTEAWLERTLGEIAPTATQSGDAEDACGDDEECGLPSD